MYNGDCIVVQILTSMPVWEFQSSGRLNFLEGSRFHRLRTMRPMAYADDHTTHEIFLSVPLLRCEIMQWASEFV